MPRRLACAALIAAGFCAPALADLDRLPGTYQAEAEAAACRLRLDPPAAAPEDSLVVAETVSGLVLAFPGCPAGLSEAVFWRAPADGSRLTLIDAGGARIATLAPSEARGWRGETGSGAAVALNPD
ncbi:MAG: hypothetical protein ACFE0P_08525 [Oceanicaulis sp.]